MKTKCGFFGLSAFSVILFMAGGNAHADQPSTPAGGLCIPVLMDCPGFPRPTSTATASPRPTATPSAHPTPTPSPRPTPTPAPVPTKTTPPQKEGQFLHRSFSNNAGGRDYYLYIPSAYDGTTPLPLMVVLHGCFGSATDFARETGFNQLAEKYRFAVIYPEQTYSANPWKCWNWFETENLRRGTGEISIIVGMIHDLSDKVILNQRKIYAVGLSAGAALASNLGACYSDLFAGVGVHSGLEYEAATSESEAHQVVKQGSPRNAKITGSDAAKCTGTRAQPLAVAVVHGKSDQYVNPINSSRVVSSFAYMNDLLDDGQANGSQTDQPASAQDGQAKGYKYRLENFGGSSGIRIQRMTVESLPHAWSGAAVRGQYADPNGPSASEMMWAFLSRFSR